MPDKKVEYRCERCGSYDVRRDAQVQWDAEGQRWEAVAEFDNADCEQCGGETTLEEVSARLWWVSSSGLLELRMTLEEAERVSHSGQCDEDVRALSTQPHIAEQLAALKPATVAEELGEYGAWSEEELEDHPQNLQRILWCAAGDTAEEARMENWPGHVSD